MTDILRIVAQAVLAVGFLSMGAMFIAAAVWAWIALFLWAKRDWAKLREPAPVAAPSKWRPAA